MIICNKTVNNSSAVPYKKTAATLKS